MLGLRRTMVLAGACFVLGACGSPSGSDEQNVAGVNPETGAPIPATSQAAVAAELPSGRPAAFAQCATCHSAEPGRNGVGPSLFGIVGMKAGSAPGFAYSAQLKESGIIWDDAKLDEWLAAPQRVVPGTRMAFAGLPGPDQRKQVIEYLKTLK